jgi:hypothetical protein
MLPPMGPLMTGLLVTISHLLAALLPTTQYPPSAKAIVPVAAITAPASRNDFIASLLTR